MRTAMLKNAPAAGRLCLRAITTTATRSESCDAFHDMTMANGMPLSLRGRVAWVLSQTPPL
jgi:hypothetical protein